MNGIPPPLRTDVEDVAWALESAATLWRRGAAASALFWLRRAVQTAALRESAARVVVLAHAAADLADALDRVGALAPRGRERAETAVSALEYEIVAVYAEPEFDEAPHADALAFDDADDNLGVSMAWEDSPPGVHDAPASTGGFFLPRRSADISIPPELASERRGAGRGGEDPARRAARAGPPPPGGEGGHSRATPLRTFIVPRRAVTDDTPTRTIRISSPSAAAGGYER